MSRSPKRARSARCPQCGNAADLSGQNRVRPFCSERCKQIDLGAWASESYRMPAAESPTDPDPGRDPESS